MAQASMVPKMVTAILRIPMMRFTFPSEERLRDTISEGERVS